MKPWLWMIGLVLSLGLPAQAADTPRSVLQTAAEDVYQALQSECRVQRLSTTDLYQLVDRLLLPHADSEGMSRWVMGKHWKRASAAQRELFVTEFKALLVRTYSTAIQKVSPDQIAYLPDREPVGGEKAVVRTELRQAGAETLPIDYYMHRKTGRWLVYDVRIEGISLITNYRTSFAAEISAHGIQGLLERMQRKSRQQSSASDKLQVARAGNC